MAVPVNKPRRRYRRPRSTSAVIQPRQVEFEDLSLSSQVLYLTLYETWRFLRNILQNVEDVENGEARRDEDMDEVDEDEVLRLMRRLSLGSTTPYGSIPASHGSTTAPYSHYQEPVSELAKPEVCEMRTQELSGGPRRSGLPDCVPPSSPGSSNGPTDQSRMPDLVQRRRTFRVDAQWIQSAQGPISRDEHVHKKEVRHMSGDWAGPDSRDWSFEEGGSKADLTHVSSVPRVRRWSYSGMDDVDGEERYRGPSRSLGTQDIYPGPSEDRRMDPCRQPRQSVTVSRSQSWKQCGNDLSRLSIRRQKLRPLDAAVAFSLENCGNTTVGGRSVAPLRRHSVAGSESRVVRRQTTLTDVFVLATLAGAYYCLNKLKSVFAS